MKPLLLYLMIPQLDERTLTPLNTGVNASPVATEGRRARPLNV